MAHIINRLQFEVRYPDEEQAFQLRHNFALTFQEQIVQAVDAVCSRHVGEDESLRIDRLVIDLGEFTSGAFATNFAANFQAKFEKEFTQKLAGTTEAEKEISHQLSKEELFQYFLQKGVLPWWADASGIDLNEITLELLRHQPDSIRHFFYTQRFAANIWKRAALQLNKETKSLIVALIPELKKAKEILQTLLQEILRQTNKETISTNASFETVIDDLILVNAPSIFKHPNNGEIISQLLEQNIAEIFTEENAPIIRLIKENKAQWQRTTDANRANETQSSFSAKEENTTSNRNDARQDELLQTRHEEKDEEEEEKYFVKHAGIVLLAPFLPMFFRNLSLLQEGEWKSKETQYAAIHLLKFLSTGLQRTPEYDLTLEKIICGVAIHEPIPADVVLTEQQTTEAKALLHSVIAHWKAIKNTSLAGLRETFLKRDGVLKKKENGWLLQVERKTLDVLIDSIPWGYSTLVFPWCPSLIFVEW